MGSIPIPELELIILINSIGIGIENFELELKFPTTKLNPEINLPLL